MKITRIQVEFFKERLTFHSNLAYGWWAWEVGELYYRSPSSIGEHPVSDYRKKTLLRGLYLLI